jgi:hypothetical protein
MRFGWSLWHSSFFFFHNTGELSFWTCSVKLWSLPKNPK